MQVQSILLPLCLLVSASGSPAVHVSLSLKAKVGVVPRSTFSLFSPFVSHLPPPPSLTLLPCLPLPHSFHWPQENTSHWLMGRRHGSNSLKIHSFQNKKHEFGSIIAVEQNGSVWCLTLRQHCGDLERASGRAYECEPICKFRKVFPQAL